MQGVLAEHQGHQDALDEGLHLQADLGLDSMALLNLALEVENALNSVAGPEKPPEAISEIVDLIQERLREAS